EPALRIAEDGLRVYRFFRLTASHGEERFDAEGLAACAASVDDLAHLSRERVGGEIMRMLGLAKIVRTLGQMSEIGLLSLDEPALLALTAYERLGGQAPETRLALIARDDLDAA